MLITIKTLGLIILKAQHSQKLFPPLRQQNFKIVSNFPVDLFSTFFHPHNIFNYFEKRKKITLTRQHLSPQARINQLSIVLLLLAEKFTEIFQNFSFDSSEFKCSIFLVNEITQQSERRRKFEFSMCLKALGIFQTPLFWYYSPPFFEVYWIVQSFS